MSHPIEESTGKWAAYRTGYRDGSTGRESVVTPTYKGLERRSVARSPRAPSIRVFVARVKSLFIHSDMTAVRALLAGIATWYALFLFYPGDTFTRPTYQYMAAFAPEHVWAWLWLAHAVGMWWRVFSSRPMFWIPFIINVLGAMLFLSEPVCVLAGIEATRGRMFPVVVADDIGCAIASLWVLVRTTINDGDSGWRID